MRSLAKKKPLVLGGRFIENLILYECVVLEDVADKWKVKAYAPSKKETTIRTVEKVKFREDNNIEET